MYRQVFTWGAVATVRDGTVTGILIIYISVCFVNCKNTVAMVTAEDMCNDDESYCDGGGRPFISFFLNQSYRHSHPECNECFMFL